MSVDLKNAFRLSFVTGETELPIPPVLEILARLRSSPAWDSASIAPVDTQFPLLHVEWTKAMDSSFSAMKTSKHGATFC